MTDGDGNIREEHQLDDTRPGHDRIRELVQEWDRTVSSNEDLLVGMEATGGMERNWLHLFGQIADETDLEVYCINPPNPAQICRIAALARGQDRPD